VALGWCVTFLWFYFFYGTRQTWGYAVIDGAMASYFWRQSKAKLFALPLFYIQMCFVGVNLITTLARTDDWWFAFASNRLFEIELVYILGCSVYRVRKLRKKQRSALAERPNAILRVNS
jgi:predicted membrane channel-forming protein YqfA (hemolysin III family)